MKRSRSEEPELTKVIKKRTTESTNILNNAANWLLGLFFNPADLLFFAAKKGDLAKVNELITQGVKLNTADAERAANELHHAIVGNKPLIAKTLIAVGANRETFYESMTFLHCAMQHRQIEIVQALIDAGDNKEALYYHGMTPLHYAIQHEQTEIVQLLLAAGANKEALHKGMTPLHHAIEVRNTEIVQALLTAGVNKEALYLGMTSLHYAIEYGQTEIVQALLKAGANMEALDDGMTPLLWAIKYGQTEIVQALIKAGANIEVLYNGMTPLHFAIACEQTEIVPARLTAGANRNDLLKIVNKVHVVKDCPLQTIIVLYFHFNRKRGWKKSPTPLLDIYYFSHKVGHILGLEGQIYFDESGMEFDVETRGGHNGDSLGHLTEYVQLYNKIYPTPLFKRIVKAFVFSNNLIDPCRNCYHDDAEFDFYKKYLADQLVYFSSGWYRHTVGLALYGNYLIYANRGAGGANNTGCRIFKINDRKLISSDLINVLIDDSIPSEKEFHAILAKIVDLNSPIVSFLSKGQKHPTCTFANPKSAIEAMIVLLQVGPSASIEKVKEQFTKELEREKYKSFTSFVRNAMIDELIKNMSYAEDKYLIAFYVALAKKIIYQHGGGEFSRSKDFEELMRASNLYARLPSQVKNRIDEDKNFLQFMGKLNSCNKENTSKPIVHQMRQRTRSHHVDISKEKMTLNKADGLKIATHFSAR